MLKDTLTLIMGCFASDDGWSSDEFDEEVSHSVGQ